MRQENMADTTVTPSEETKQICLCCQCRLCFQIQLVQTVNTEQFEILARSLQLVCIVCILVAAMFLVLGKHLYHVVDAENGDGRLGCKFQTLHFRNCRLQNASLFVVTDTSICEIEANPAHKT